MNLDFRSEQAIRGARMFALAQCSGRTCADCRFAQPFTLQPSGAVCVHRQYGRTGRSIKLDLPACAEFLARPATDLALTIPAPLKASEREPAVA